MKKITAAAFLLSTLITSGCTNMFFQPQGSIFADPADYGQRYEVIKFNSADGTELTAMYFRPEGEAKGTVVHFHGNAQNMTAHFPYSFWLASEGFNVFIFDYRGYGASQGTVSVKGAVEDGVAALEHVVKIPGVQADKIAVFGQSLGGALAVAAIPLASGPQPAALALDSTFYSYRGEASAVLRQHWWSWPFSWLPWLTVSDAYSPAKNIGKIHCPKLFFHSENDRIVPLAQGEKLFKAAPEPKRMLFVPAGHTQAFAAFKNIYGPELVGFLNAAFSGK